jgi:lycopene cyclase CruA
MLTHLRRTGEINAPYAEVQATLARPELWPRLIPNADQLGAHWLCGGELFAVEHSVAGAQHSWQARSADGATALTIVVSLRDALITTHATVDIALQQPFRAARWLGRAAQHEFLAEIVRYAQGALERLLAPPPAADLAARYPRTVAAFEAMGACEHLDRIAHLDAVWAGIRAGTPPPANESIYTLTHAPLPAPQYDLIYAGGGLGLLHAAVMAQRGHRVLLFDRGEVGCAHREWNISRAELDALVATGFCTWDELQPVIMAEYENGVVRFHAPASTARELWMPEVLNVALDATALLSLARRKLAAAGGTVLDHRSFRGVEVSANGPLAVQVQLARPDGTAEHYSARLLLDGMGSASPLALRRFGGQPFAGVCPTVGTVASGFVRGAAPDEHNPRVGDILLSVADAQRGQQYMWEGFPGRADDLTVYLFYYDTLHTRKSSPSHPPTPISYPPSLMQLFEDYFALLPSYKRPGHDFAHHKPVYGYIPARHSVRRQEAPLLRGVLPIGDSAAQQSPLTFCGFGSHVRNLARTTGLLEFALHHDLLAPAQLHPISAYQVNVSLNWVFSRFMQPWAAPDDVNQLQNIFLGVLNELGGALAQRFFRDRMIWGDYHKMILGMFRHHPRIVFIAWRVLGPAGVRQWIADYLAYSRAALLAYVGSAIPAPVRGALSSGLGRLVPSWALRLRAHLAEWQAMGWT